MPLTQQTGTMSGAAGSKGTYTTPAGNKYYYGDVSHNSSGKRGVSILYPHGADANAIQDVMNHFNSMPEARNYDEYNAASLPPGNMNWSLPTQGTTLMFGNDTATSSANKMPAQKVPVQKAAMAQKMVQPPAMSPNQFR